MKYCLMAVVIVSLTPIAHAAIANYETDMSWTQSNGGVLVLSPTNMSGTDVTVTFSCNLVLCY